MTKISLSVRHGGAPDDLQSFAADKCARLDKFLRAEARIEFVLERDQKAWKGEAILHGSRQHERFVAHEGHAEAHGCVEKLVDRIARQLGKSKERRKDHHGHALGTGDESPRDAAPDEPSYEEVVRSELDGGDAKAPKKDGKKGAPPEGGPDGGKDGKRGGKK